MNNRQEREKAGRRAEALAALLLRLKGYRILEMRYKTPDGEIDIIARKGNVLAIIEVKQRQTLNAAIDSLTPYMWNRIHAATDIYISRNPAIQNLAVRFDAISLVGNWNLKHHRDIWRP